MSPVVLARRAAVEREAARYGYKVTWRNRTATLTAADGYNGDLIVGEARVIVGGSHRGLERDLERIAYAGSDDALGIAPRI